MPEGNIVRTDGERIYLRRLEPADVSDAYLRWMNDPEITRFLESRFTSYSHRDLTGYVLAMQQSDANLLCGIFLQDGDRHVGNIKLGNIHPVHRYADVGLIIGEKREWGKGYGTEALVLATRYAFDVIGLNSLYAGINIENVSSERAFLKAGFRRAGILAEHRYFEGRFVDEIIVERCRQSP